MVYPISMLLTRSMRIICGIFPFGRGKKLFSTAGRLMDEVIRGWQSTASSAGRRVSRSRWTMALTIQRTGTSKVGNAHIQDSFACCGARIADTALCRSRTVFSSFSHALPGESGTRNPMRGDGYF